MSEVLTKLIETDNLIWIGGILVALVAILSSALRGIVSSVARERTRRDIAAYIAEGSMTPEQGEKLMAAGQTKDSCC
jgi:hypothetical protein